MPDTTNPISDTMRPLLDRLKQNRVGTTSAYKKINSGELRVVKLGRRTYVRDEDWAAFLASLPVYSPKAKNGNSRAA